MKLVNTVNKGAVEVSDEYGKRLLESTEWSKPKVSRSKSTPKKKQEPSTSEGSAVEGSE